MDSGAVVSTCPPCYGHNKCQEIATTRNLFGASGNGLKHSGKSRIVSGIAASNDNQQIDIDIRYDVANVVRPLVALGEG